MENEKSAAAGGFYRRRGKRLFDLAVSIPALILLAPLAAAVALAVRWGLGPPVVFRQVRPGLGGRPFTLLKFRTLRETRDARGEPLPDRARATPLGRRLRAASLDELPELVNVVRGEMSLVGPRPLLTKYLELYTPEEARRHEVRPGITGWAQVHGRNRTTWEERFAHDVWYVDHLSFGLDLRILARTAAALLRSDGGLEQGARLGEYTGRGGGRP
jgi:lipopolysaccharide/colanic/teichoic acid biosynthesis glycosyltransferase